MLNSADILDDLLDTNTINNYTISAEKDKLSLEFNDGKHVIVSIANGHDGYILSFSQLTEG